ncbi:MAG: biotin--[Clostridia bacterium]|nr:biotin--[acetyl-CoA-carboxylase] ligase [Clostridia bacterium]
MKIIRLEKTTSTNDYIKKFIKKGQDTLVLAKYQTEGRGTKGRSFSSDVGGIYLTRLKFYENLSASDAFSIVIDVSMAVVKTLLAFGLKPKIKWPNDILVGDKKICGILTENKIDNGQISYSIVGIGLNVTNKLDDELQSIATTMTEILGKVDFEAVLMTLLFNLSGKSNMAEYARYSCVLGKDVTILEGGTEYKDRVEEVLPDGRIKLANGKILSSAEIKLKV